ncbi:hypothetical protein GZL_04898 [Streptomyces sp. 769]|nr:hypothetical protein GZL_04898 [Streptomyces sp. 769]
MPFPPSVTRDAKFGAPPGQIAAAPDSYARRMNRRDAPTPRGATPTRRPPRTPPAHRSRPLHAQRAAPRPLYPVGAPLLVWQEHHTCSIWWAIRGSNPEPMD